VWRSDWGMWFVCDTKGVVCCSLTYALLGVSSLTVTRHGLWPRHGIGASLCRCAFNMCFALSLCAHAACVLTNPGAVPLDADISEEMQQCSKCHSAKPPRAHHCRVCNRCIMKMDHHCLWVNNCVGACNQKHFLLFISYTQLQCWATMFSLSARLVSITSTVAASQHNQFEGIKVLECIIVFFIALLSGLFTLIVLCDQVSKLMSDQTGIESLQGHSLPARHYKESLQEVMGRGPSWRWFVPIPIRGAQVKDNS